MTSAQVLKQLLLPFLKILFLCAGLAGLVLGACLFLRAEPTLRALRNMNRWVSSRRAMKALEIPHTVESAVRRSNRWLGIAFAIAGSYAFVVLCFAIDPAKTANLLGAKSGHVLVRIAVDSLRWLLIVGSMLAVAVGLMVAFAPRALQRCEAWGNRWISSRRLVEGADRMHMPFDRLAETYPRAAGAAIFGLSAIATALSIVLLLQR